MAKAFMRHGALAVELLNPAVPAANKDVVNLGKYLDEGIEEISTWADSARVRLHVSTFFSEVTPVRARYLAQLLGCTLTFFALTVNDATTTYMKESLESPRCLPKDDPEWLPAKDLEGAGPGIALIPAGDRRRERGSEHGP
jgi:hypothetical protein